MEQVVLVDPYDRELGTMEKLEAHEKGVLHRAFSVCVFNKANELLLQQRAEDKYHSGSLWSNTCCSHPRPKEAVIAGASRRLVEEMGFSCSIEPVHKFIYRAELDHNLTEHELDHVFFGTYDDAPAINPEEVADWKYISLPDLAVDIKKRPEAYTAWFKLLVPVILKLRSHEGLLSVEDLS